MSFMARYGEFATEIGAVDARKTNPAAYMHIGSFDERIFQTEATRCFRGDAVAGARYNDRSIPAMLDLLRRMSQDSRILDIRWMAYVLATVIWETSRPVKQPSGKSLSQWGNPIEELGKGRLNSKSYKNYYLPVKVAPAANGTAIVTEQDGEIFTVSITGKIIRTSRKAIVGSTYGNPIDSAYEMADGTEYSYYGRGYCQLTWWNNYAETGAEIGLGLDLLFHPEKALDPTIAYNAMVHCMIYGTGFANGKKLQMYFSGALTDYVGARRMVNGQNHAKDIAHAARIFEACLMAAKP